MFRTAPGEARALIEDWINRPTLRELVEAFGGTWPTGNLEEQVAELAEFSKIWDYRSGASRLIFHDDPDAEDPHAELTYRAAKELGMMDPPPPSENEYDYMLILGGLATGVEPRVKYAAKLIEDGLKIRKQIAGLGSYRELHDREGEVAAAYLPEARNEVDLLAAVMDSHLNTNDQVGLTIEEDCSPEVPSVWEHTLAGGNEVAVYSAANQSDGRAANTAETYELFFRVATPSISTTVVLITSAIYAAYQHFDATRVLGPHGATVETVGLIASPRQLHPPDAYRQEVRSTLRSAEGVVAASPGPTKSCPGA